MPPEFSNPIEPEQSTSDFARFVMSLLLVGVLLGGYSWFKYNKQINTWLASLNQTVQQQQQEAQGSIIRTTPKTQPGQSKAGDCEPSLIKGLVTVEIEAGGQDSSRISEVVKATGATRAYYADGSGGVSYNVSGGSYTGGRYSLVVKEGTEGDVIAKAKALYYVKSADQPLSYCPDGNSTIQLGN